MERQLADRLAIRELAFSYARAVDRRDWPLAETLFTDHAVLVAPAFELVGIRAILRGLRTVERYRSTFHAVHNQLFALDGDTATGETYCVANHVLEREGGVVKIDWGIRYQDRCRRGPGGGWLFARRELVVDWQQELPLIQS